MLPSGQPLLGQQQTGFQQQQQQQGFPPMNMQQQPGSLMPQQLQSDKNRSFITSSYPFQSTAVPPIGLGMQGAQPGSISYPTPRSLQPAAVFNAPMTSVLPPPNSGPLGGAPGPLAGGMVAPKHRAFTGTVTKIQDNFGFIDSDVFFQTSVVVKGLNPKMGDRVLVDAIYNATMPFKWNATRVQILPPEGPRQNMNPQGFGPGAGYNAVPPPLSFNSEPPPSNFPGSGNLTRSPQNDRRRDQRNRDEEREAERENRRREERMREREKEREKEKQRSGSPASSRKRSRSPRARASRSPVRRPRSRPGPRYIVQIPKITLSLRDANVSEIKRRYSNMYIPSDFFAVNVHWLDAFPADRPLKMNVPCNFHVMPKDVDRPVENTAVLEPADADYTFTAKVMLISLPILQEIYQKSCELAEDTKESDSHDHVHPTRLINFLVGVRNRNETMAIGGPWSPSLDGEDPDKDPQVLIRTAIRTCMALTGIDLSRCTQWYRFLDIHYHRAETTHKGKVAPAHVETVVVFMPDIWTCVPTRREWGALHASYCKPATTRSAGSGGDSSNGSGGGGDGQQQGAAAPTAAAATPTCGVGAAAAAAEGSGTDGETTTGAELAEPADDSATTIKEEAKEEEEEGAAANNETKKEAADPEVKEEPMEVTEPPRQQQEEEEEEKEDVEEGGERCSELPQQPHIVVHPSRTAKSGKFSCTTMSLSVLLDYRTEDAKEHSFEVNMFAELFNEMLMRDFGFQIYRALADAPDKPKPSKKKSSPKKGKEEEKTKEVKSEGDQKVKTEPEVVENGSKHGEEDDEEVEEESNASSGSKKQPEDSSKSSKEKPKKKGKPKMLTFNPALLLSFTYFDLAHSGYLLEKDVEEILYMLGLNLTRAQTRKLLQKVVVRDSLHYRKLTDRQADTVPESTEPQDEKVQAKALRTLATGNTNLPHLGCKSIEDQQKEAAAEGVVQYEGSEIHLDVELSHLERVQLERVTSDTERLAFKQRLSQARESARGNAATVDRLKQELQGSQKQLEDTEYDLKVYEERCTHYRTAFRQLKQVVEPALKEDEDAELVEKKMEKMETE